MALRSVYRIAAHFRIFDVDAMLRRPHKETVQLRRWMEFEQLEPFGELRADYRTAQIVAMIHNVAVTPKDQKSIEEFLLKFGENRGKKQSVAEQVMILNAMAAAFSAPEAPG